MKLLLNFSLNKQDFEDLQDNFNRIESYEMNKGEYDYVVVDTKELTYQEFDDWLKGWIDIGYSIVFDKDKQQYILTDIS